MKYTNDMAQTSSIPQKSLHRPFSCLYKVFRLRRSSLRDLFVVSHESQQPDRISSACPPR